MIQTLYHYRRQRLPVRDAGLKKDEEEDVEEEEEEEDDDDDEDEEAAECRRSLWRLTEGEAPSVSSSLMAARLLWSGGSSPRRRSRDTRSRSSFWDDSCRRA